MDQPQAVTPFYMDKGLYVAVLTPVLLFLNQKFGLALDASQLISFVLPIVAYIIGHKYKSATIATAQVAANGAARAPAKTLNA